MAKFSNPPFADSQCREILELSRVAGPAGVSKADLIFAKKISQCGARIGELERMGFVIAHIQRDGERFVRFVLESEPLKSTISDGADWYERSAGKPRPSANAENVSDLPLFQGGDR